MSPPPKAMRSNGVPITPSTSLEEAKNIARTARGVIKDADDARKFLVKEGWTVQNEEVMLETLTRFLLAHSLQPKLAVETANLLAAVGFLIMTNLQEGIAKEVAQSITELLKHSIASMTVDICEGLEQHASKLVEMAQSQATIAQDMQKTQENMAESARQAATQVRTYSQIAATPLHPQSTPSPPITYSQLKIQNREQIK